MEELLKPKREEEKKKTLDQLRVATTETAIQTVKAKIKEKQDAEAAAIAAAEGMSLC